MLGLVQGYVEVATEVSSRTRRRTLTVVLPTVKSVQFKRVPLYEATHCNNLTLINLLLVVCGDLNEATASRAVIMT